MISNPEHARLAYEIARSVESPLVRLCADTEPLMKMSQQLFSVVSENSGVKLPDGSKVFVIGPYSEAFRSDAERYLQERDFSYSEMRVDGISRDGKLNLAIWMERKDLNRSSENSAAETFCDDLGIEVFDYVQRFEDLPEDVIDPASASGIQRKTPVVARFLFKDGEDFRDQNRYRSLPPNVWHLYGCEPAPRKYLELMNDVYSGRVRIPDALMKKILKEGIPNF